MDEERLTRLAIAGALDTDRYYVETVDVEELVRVRQVRRIGRDIAREIGWKVRTGVIDTDDDRLKIWVVVAEPTRELLTERVTLVIEWLVKEAEVD